jgi:hypothetical protein
VKTVEKKKCRIDLSMVYIGIFSKKKTKKNPVFIYPIKGVLHEIDSTWYDP